MNALDRIDLWLATLDQFAAAVAWYARQRRVRWILAYRPWVVLPDLWHAAARRAAHRAEMEALNRLPARERLTALMRLWGDVSAEAKGGAR